MAKTDQKDFPSGETAEQMRQVQPCLFLIDVSVNGDAAAAITDYVEKRGKMPLFADSRDKFSAGADKRGEEGEPGERYLQAGLAKATHVLGLLSPDNPEPRWLARIAQPARTAGAEIAVLILKGTGSKSGSYDTFTVLRGIRSLNEYLFRVSPNVDRIIFNNPEYGGLIAHTAPNHPLDAFLDWDK